MTNAREHKHCARYPGLQIGGSYEGPRLLNPTTCSGKKFYLDNISFLGAGCRKQSSVFIPKLDRHKGKMSQFIMANMNVLAYESMNPSILIHSLSLYLSHT